jgi:thioredoxin 1
MNRYRSTLSFILAGAFAALLAGTALAEEAEPEGRIEAFTQARFEALQKEGKTILVDVYATWCSTCRAQSPVLEELLAEEAFSDVVALRLDWDDQRDIGRALGAWRQSTLLVFKGEREMARVVAETREEHLRRFLESGSR